MQGPSSTEGEDDFVAQINIIPLVDVVLVLLIIFMVTTVFARDSSLKLDLPPGSREDQLRAKGPAEVTISVDTGSNIFINGKPVTLDTMVPEIEKLCGINTKELVLRGDKEVLYGKMTAIMDKMSQVTNPADPSIGLQMTLALTPGTRK